MARLTIEEKWWSDPRRERLAKLTGSMEMADAAALRAWRLAMEFWGHSHGLIPQEIFNTLETAPKLIEAGLAKVEGDMIYVRGSSQYLSWLHEKRLAAVTAGRVSSQRPRDNKGRLLPKKARKTSSKTPTRVQRESNASQRESNESPTPANEVQPFGFGFGLEEEINTSPRKLKSEYPTEFEVIYKTYPCKEGKSEGFKVYSKEILTLDDQNQLAAAIRAYVALCRKEKRETKYMKHFGRFMNCWREYLDEIPSTLKPKSLEEL